MINDPTTLSHRSIWHKIVIFCELYPKTLRIAILSNNGGKGGNTTVVNSAGFVPRGQLSRSCSSSAGCWSLRDRKNYLLQITPSTCRRPAEGLRRVLGAGQGLHQGVLSPLLFNTFVAVPTAVLQHSNAEPVGQVHLGEGVPQEVGWVWRRKRPLRR